MVIARSMVGLKGNEILDDTEAGDELDWEGFEDEKSLLNVLEEKPRRDEAGDGSNGEKKAKKKDKGASKKIVKEVENKRDATVNAFAALPEDDEEETDVSAWLKLGLSPSVLVSLAKLKFSIPTPIQSAAIPDILAGEDVIGKASTGSGKTLAFGIPIIESILEAQSKSKSDEVEIPTALILSPTRELAHQISQHIMDICIHLPVNSPRVATITGGLSIQKQERLLSKADIVIGTPGRLWEVISTVPGSLNRLKKIKFLVADEADRLLSDGHFKEVEEILTALDRKEIKGGPGEEDNARMSSRQTLVFSATFQKELQRKLVGRSKVSNNILDNQASLEYLITKLNFRSNPKFIDVNPVRQMAANLREGLLECGAMEKDLYLYAILLQYPKARILVFTNSISSVRRLLPLLQNLNFKPFGLHSEMPQKARLRSIERFTLPTTTATTSSILIATDVAARGLDIPSVDLIVHYHVPRSADIYIHRSGRTARAESSGSSILLCAPPETQPVQRLISKIHTTTTAATTSHPLRTLSINRTLLTRLKPRLTLSANIVSAQSSLSKASSETSWLRRAAADLDVEYDPADFADAVDYSSTSQSRGRKRATRETASATAGMDKRQIAAWKGELGALLRRRVNVGVSERYLSAGGLDLGSLLAERDGNDGGLGDELLGMVDGISGW